MHPIARRICALRRAAAGLITAGCTIVAVSQVAHAAAPPEIRTSANNRVPACATPERLMAFLKSRNPSLDRRYAGIAAFYKQHGEAWRVRWDYAFFQMAIETNFLTYRRPDGRMGDVDPRQNNFAGIGTTGGGVPGDSFPDVPTGVLAQIQHLVVYSGETIATPIAPRTQLKQEHILKKSLELNRPVRFGDLARRWAADPKYASSIEWVADGFRAEHCRGRTDPTPRAEAPGTQNAAATPPQTPRAAQAAPASPVRTIWSRDQKPAEPAKLAAVSNKPAPVAPKAAVKEPQLRDTSPVAQKQVISAAEQHATPATAPSEATALPIPAIPAGPSPNEPEPRLAMVSPPAMLTLPPPAAQEPLVAPDTAAAVVAPASAAPAPQSNPAFNPAANPPSGLGVKPTTCSINTASFGGDKAVLIRTGAEREVRYVAVSVLDGFEKPMTASFIASRAPGGEPLGEFSSIEAALAKARELCPAQ